MYLFPAKNIWVDTSIFIKWLNEIWFRTYNFRKNTENNILYFEYAKSHLSEDLKNLLIKNRCYYRLIPSGLTSICQPLELYVNKPFKDALKAKYINFIIFWKNIKKLNPEDLMNGYRKFDGRITISGSTITHSFYKPGNNFLSNGKEDFIFQWPKTTRYDNNRRYTRS